MELNLQKQAINMNEVIYDGTVEQPIECDVLLPDSCPDIYKILRCEVVPALLSSTVSGERLTVDGMATAHLYYLSEDGCIRHTEYKIPYSKVIELRVAPVKPTIYISQNIDYFNCRAVSQRRLDMRGAVVITAKVTSQAEEQIVCGCEGAGIQLNRDMTENTVVVGQASRQMNVKEELELGYGKPSAGNIVRYTATADVNDYKIVAGKIVTKGELKAKIIYQCEEDNKKLEVMEYAIPVSQVIDMDGVDEDCNCNVWYDVCGTDITLKSNDDGEQRRFAVDLSANACAIAHRKMELDTACDCYSTQYECTQVQKQVNFNRLVDMVNDEYQYKEMLDLPQNIKSIIDIWCVASGITTKYESDGIAVSGKINICMFVYENDDEIAYYDQARDFSHKIAVNEELENPLFQPIIRPDTVTFSMNGHEKMEVRCAVKLQGSIYCQRRKKVITDIAVDESKKKERKDNMLYLYYATENEPVWEIAKRYNTSVEAIVSENEIEGNTLNDRRMLLIPMK